MAETHRKNSGPVAAAAQTGTDKIFSSELNVSTLCHRSLEILNQTSKKYVYEKTYLFLRIPIMSTDYRHLGCTRLKTWQVCLANV